VLAHLLGQVVQLWLGRVMHLDLDLRSRLVSTMSGRAPWAGGRSADGASCCARVRCTCVKSCITGEYGEAKAGKVGTLKQAVFYVELVAR